MRSVQTAVSARTPEGWATPVGLATRALVTGVSPFRRPGGHASTFLHPFARRALPRFDATMGALTPVRHSSPHRSPCFTCTAFLTIPPPTTRCPPVVAFARYSSARRVSRVRPRGRANGSRLRARLGVSPGHQAESSSSSYGLVVHLLLLSTPPHGDAVAVGYRQEAFRLKRTFTSLTCTLAGALALTLRVRRPITRSVMAAFPRSKVPFEA